MTIRELLQVKELYNININYIVDYDAAKEEAKGVKNFNDRVVDLFSKVDSFYPVVSTFHKDHVAKMQWLDNDVDYTQIFEKVFSGEITL